MLPAWRTAPGIAVRTRPVPQRTGLLRVVAAVILGVLHDIFTVVFFVLFWVGPFAGHDSKSLLFSLLDEFLFVFHSESLVVKNVTINNEIDRDSWTLQATA